MVVEEQLQYWEVPLEKKAGSRGLCPKQAHFGGLYVMHIFFSGSLGCVV